ncbi:hypothetical protein V2J09_019137 [Rumex salicifolius]
MPHWDHSRSGYNSALYTGNVQREGLMSYKQFIQELEDDVLPSEDEHRYQEYKTEYIMTQKKDHILKLIRMRTAYAQCFSISYNICFPLKTHCLHRLRNKYHPTNLVSVIERRNELVRNVAKNFLMELHAGELNLGPSTNVNKAEQTNERNSEDEVDGAKRRPHGRKGTDHSSAPKAPSVSSEPRRILLDVDSALALVRKLDSEKGIDGNILSRPDNEKINRDKSHGGSMGPVIIIRGSTCQGLEGVELLDTLTTYLWCVHGVDYYGMIETTEPKGLRHVRSEGKDSDATSNGLEWENKLDSHWKERLRIQDPLEIMTAKEKIVAVAGDALDPYVRKIRDEKYGWKYGCGAKGCTKLSHAPEFVQKHLKLKHIDLLMECTSKVREELYFENYMNDPDAPGGKPVMQQNIKKENLQRRRTPLENRLKDDRPGNGPEIDFQSNDDDPEKGNDDGPMFDSFDGQRIHVPPFAQEPPQVLMHVPDYVSKSPPPGGIKVYSRRESVNRIRGPVRGDKFSFLGSGRGSLSESCNPSRTYLFLSIESSYSQLSNIGAFIESLISSRMTRSGELDARMASVEADVEKIREIGVVTNRREALLTRMSRIEPRAIGDNVVHVEVGDGSGSRESVAREGVVAAGGEGSTLLAQKVELPLFEGEGPLS